MTLRTFLCLASLSLLNGCVTVVPYTPRETVLQEMQPADAAPLLEATVTRVAEPRVVSAEADRAGEYLRYTYLQTIHGPFGIPVDSVERELQLHYVNLDHLDVYDNHYVYIYVYEDRLVGKLRFENSADAKSFCDLLMSFRAQRVYGGAIPEHGAPQHDALTPE